MNAASFVSLLAQLSNWLDEMRTSGKFDIDIDDDRPDDSTRFDHLVNGPANDDPCDDDHLNDNDVSPWVDGACRASRWRVRS